MFSLSLTKVDSNDPENGHNGSAAAAGDHIPAVPYVFLGPCLPPPVSQKAHTQTNHIMVKGPEVQGSEDHRAPHTHPYPLAHNENSPLQTQLITVTKSLLKAALIHVDCLPVH